MTRIDFYTHVGDRLQVACRLAAKGQAQGHKLVVYCPDADRAVRFDRQLWVSPATGFVPHCAAEDPLAPRTPVVLTRDGEHLVHDDILINLADEWPAFFSRFRRLIEIVSTDDADRAAARSRFKFYRDRGYEIHTHDLSAAKA